jgi:hypothetical protein
MSYGIAKSFNILCCYIVYAFDVGRNWLAQLEPRSLPNHKMSDPRPPVPFRGQPFVRTNKVEDLSLIPTNTPTTARSEDGGEVGFFVDGQEALLVRRFGTFVGPIERLADGF